MLYRSLLAMALVIVALVGFGCSGGGSGAGLTRGRCAQGGDAPFCLTSCSLGCSNLGCSVTDIAPNQPISLTFSQPVDPSSVDFSTVSIKTSSGRTPEGRFIVDGATVTFRPEIKVVGGQTSFGFLANETYVLNLPDAADSGQVLKSIIGHPLGTPLVCNLRVSQRIVDLDQAPPKAKLITPAVTSNAPKNTVILLEFSEIIDIAPFQGATTQTSPVQYLLRKTKQRPGGGPKDRICDVNSRRQILEGLPEAENDPVRGITTVILRPTVPLPSQICVEIVVTNQVRDLAGTPAKEHSFVFTTEILVSGESKVEEAFVGDSQLDKTVSSGTWSGGEALPPQIGGMGTLGEFNIAAGQQDSKDPNKFWFNTDKHVVPGRFTPTGKDITVTGGIFEWTKLELKEGFTIAFTGSNHAQIRVRGGCKISGRIEANAPGGSFFLAGGAAGAKAKGGAGSKGNCGGAAGGQGGDSCQNTGAKTEYNGRTGEVVKLPGGNGYATQAAKTGGKGSPLFPTAGKHNTYCALTGVFCGLMSVGGGGGGFIEPGKRGEPVFVSGKIQNPCRDPKSSPSSPYPNTGGGVFDLGALSNTKTGPNGSVDFYAVGGSGGGGGGSHPALTRRSPFDKWLPGAGGAGGGGVVILRVGQSLEMKGKGTIQVKGGQPYTFDGVQRAGESGDNLFNVPAPGGGGSGGSILVQVFGRVDMGGLLDCSGGKGGILDNSPTSQSGLLCRSNGGDGGAGYFRLETPNGPGVIAIGAGVPKATAKNGGKLTDREFKGVSQSNFYTTKLTFPPNFLRYILEVEVDGKRKVYSDDAAVGNPSSKVYDKDYAGLAASTEPVYLQLQGAKVSTVTGKPDLNTLGPWRDHAFSKTFKSLNDDDATGLRFRLTYDTNGGARKIAVKKFRVNFVE